jgi:hypothetical protein
VLEETMKRAEMSNRLIEDLKARGLIDENGIPVADSKGKKLASKSGEAQQQELSGTVNNGIASTANQG